MLLLAVAESVGRHLTAVSAQAHAAPAPRSLFACVIEVQDAVLTLAEPGAVNISKEGGRVSRKWRKQVIGLPYLEILFGRERLSCSPQLGEHGVVRHQPIQFIHRRSANRAAIFPTQDVLPQILPQSTHSFHGARGLSRLRPLPPEAARLVGC